MMEISSGNTFLPENTLFKHFYDSKFYSSDVPPYYGRRQSVNTTLKKAFDIQETILRESTAEYRISSEDFGRLFYNTSLLLKGWIDNHLDLPSNDRLALETKIRLVEQLEAVSDLKLSTAKRQLAQISSKLRGSPMTVYERFDHMSWACTDPELIKTGAKMIIAESKPDEEILLLAIGHGATRPTAILEHYMKINDAKVSFYPIRFSTHKMKDGKVRFINDEEREYVKELSKGKRVYSVNEDTQTGYSSKIFTQTLADILLQKVRSFVVIEGHGPVSIYDCDLHVIDENDFLQIMIIEDKKRQQEPLSAEQLRPKIESLEDY